MPLGLRGRSRSDGRVLWEDTLPYCGWTKSISHHLRNPGMMIRLQIPTSNGFSWFQSGAGFRPSTVAWLKGTEARTPNILDKLGPAFRRCRIHALLLVARCHQTHLPFQITQWILLACQIQQCHPFPGESQGLRRRFGFFCVPRGPFCSQGRV